MTFPEEALQKLTKFQLANLPLDYQSKFNSTLANHHKDIGALRNDFEKPELYLVGVTVSTVNVNVCNILIILLSNFPSARILTKFER